MAFPFTKKPSPGRVLSLDQPGNILAYIFAQSLQMPAGQKFSCEKWDCLKRIKTGQCIRTSRNPVKRIFLKNIPEGLDKQWLAVHAVNF